MLSVAEMGWGSEAGVTFCGLSITPSWVMTAGSSRAHCSCNQFSAPCQPDRGQGDTPSLGPEASGDLTPERVTRRATKCRTAAWGLLVLPVQERRRYSPRDEALRSPRTGRRLGSNPGLAKRRLDPESVGACPVTSQRCHAHCGGRSASCRTLSAFVMAVVEPTERNRPDR